MSTERRSNKPRARVIAFYLPQFHPIPQNDVWWERGFTEWTNVAKAKPLFKGHDQPHVPADLGFYDLRVPEVREAQAEMARECGVEGFCYWHYWFGGKRLLERPFNEVFKSGKPDFPFCLAWANKTWTGIWHGAPDRILIEQTYPGIEDYEAHFYALLDAFRDRRYIKIEGKPVFVLFYPYGLPDPIQFTNLWRELALKSGLNGLFFIGLADPSWNPAEYGFDACAVDNFSIALRKMNQLSRTNLDRLCTRLTSTDLKRLRKRFFPKPSVYLYRDFIKHALSKPSNSIPFFPCILPNWDNTPRSGTNGVVFRESSPDLFSIHLREAIGLVADRDLDRRIVFLKSWNEWAEGNYVEPDRRFGRAYLKVLKSELLG